MSYNTTFNKLKENHSEIVDDVIRILEKIANNILKDPLNLKYRTLQKDNATIKNKIIATIGGIECMVLMGFEEVTLHFYNLRVIEIKVD